MDRIVQLGTGRRATQRLGAAIFSAMLCLVSFSACGSSTTSPTPAGTATLTLATGSPFVSPTGVPAGTEGSPSGLSPAATQAPSATRAPSASGAPAETPSPDVSGPPATAALGSFDACGLLTTVELAKLIGDDVTAKVMPSAGWVAGQCAWSSPSSSFMMSVGTAASIQTFDDPAAPNARSRLDEFRKRLSALGTVQEIAGVGDGAVLGQTGMAAYKGETYIEVLKLRLTDTQLIDVVKAAVGKL
jgi:hypothetical protein